MEKVIVINSETMGEGSRELGEQLMGSFLRKLIITGSKPETIIFYNAGVKLLQESSSVLDAVEALFRSGVDIVACGTCVTYYEITDKIAVGRVSNMQEIATILLDSKTAVVTI